MVNNCMLRFGVKFYRRRVRDGRSELVTLADLSNQMPKGRATEKEVAKIANKFTEMSGNPCISHFERYVRVSLEAM